MEFWVAFVIGNQIKFLKMILEKKKIELQVGTCANIIGHIITWLVFICSQAHNY